MKKLFVFLILFIALKSFGQYPNGIQTIGSDSNVIVPKGALHGRLINWVFVDTTAANLQRIKQYPGSQIFTTSDNIFWLRNSTAEVWIPQGGGVPFDTTAIYNFINTKLTASDTTGLWQAQGKYEVYFTRINDSVTSETYSDSTIVYDTSRISFTQTNIDYITNIFNLLDSLNRDTTFIVSPTNLQNGKPFMYSTIDPVSDNDTIHNNNPLNNVPHDSIWNVDESGNVFMELKSAGGGLADSAYFWKLTGNNINAGTNRLGTINNTSLRFITNNTNFGVLDSLGNFGLGVATPLARFHIVDNSTRSGIFLDHNSNDIQTSGVHFRKSRGTYAAPTAVHDSDYNGGLGFYNYSGTQYLHTMIMGSKVMGTVTSTSIPTDFYISIDSAGIASDEPYASNTVKLVLTSKGVLGLGNNNKTPNNTSVLDISSTTRGALLPRMSSVQRSAIVTPAKGLLVFDNDSSSLFQYNGSVWQNLYNITSGGGAGTVTNVTATAPLSITGTSTITPNVVADTSKSGGNLATFSDVALKQNLVTLTTTGTTGASTFNQSTGALNIPSYSGGGGGIDSIRKAANSDSIKQYSAGVGTFAVRVHREFNVRDYGASGDSTQDATPFIQAAINACFAAGGGTVYFPNGWYWLSGALNTSAPGWSNLPNSQLYIPSAYIDRTRTHITFLGETAPNWGPAILYVDTTYSRKGVIIKSTITGSGTNPSIFGGVGFYPTFNYNFVTFKNLTIINKANAGTTGPSMSGINAINIAGIEVEDCLIGIDTSMFRDTIPSLQTAGIICPATGGEASNKITHTMVFGYRYGIIAGEHTFLNDAIVYNCYANFVINPQSVNSIYANKITSHWGYINILVPNTTIMGMAPGNTKFDIGLINIENYTTNTRWFNNYKTVVDSGNRATGQLRYIQTNTGGAPGAYSKIGGSGIYATNAGTFNTSNDKNGSAESIMSNDSSGTAAQARIQIKSNGNPLYLVKNSPLFTTSGINAAGDGSLINAANGNLNIYNTFSTGKIQMTAGNGTIANATVTANGEFDVVAHNGNVAATFKAAPSTHTILGINASSNFNTNLVWQNNGTNMWYFGNVGIGGVNSFRFVNSDGSGNAEVMSLLQAGRLGIGQTTPTAILHLKAGTATASTAPLKFAAGVQLTTPESGVMETITGNELKYSTSTTANSRGFVSVDRYIAKTGTYTATADDGTIDATSGTFTVTLPTAVGINGRTYTVTNSGSGTITIGTTSSQTFVNINATPTTLTLGAVGAAAITGYTVQSNNANWVVINKVKNE